MSRPPLPFPYLRDRWSGGCLACGICCEVYGDALAACPEDLERWRREGRHDLLAGVGPEGELWVDPATGEWRAGCPYLVRESKDHARCSIHATKPRLCRDYPTEAHGYRCVRGFRFPHRPSETPK